jgi:hypothetical protein
MTLPADLPSAMAMLGELVHDPNLVLGLQTVAVILLFSGVIAWAIVSKVAHR